MHAVSQFVMGCLIALLPGVALIAHADEPTQRSSAARLVTLGGEQAAMEWRGRGSVMGKQRFCVSSTTGSYRLTARIENYSSPPNSQPLQYTLRFMAPDGKQHLQNVSSGELREFTGTVNPTFECRGTANATMEIILSEAAALEAVSGEYSSSLLLEMSAL